MFFMDLAAEPQLSSDEDDSSDSISVISKGRMGRKITKIVISYPSVDASGNHVRLSGAIYMHKDAKAFSELVLLCHQTNLALSEAPSSKARFFNEPLLCKDNPATVVFASDYLGFGSSAHYFHPYMNHSLAARNELDMFRAGLAFLREQGYTVVSPADGLKTYITGFSQGGAVALATQRLLEADSKLCNDVNFVGTYCGDGPYDLLATFQHYLTSGQVPIMVVVPYVLLGMYESYPEEFEGIDINDYFSDKARKADIVSFIRSRPNIFKGYWYVKRKLGTDIRNLMSDEAMDMNSHIMQVLLRCFAKQNLADGSWTPTHRVVFYHSPVDPLVPYVNTQNMLRVMSPGTYLVPDISRHKGHAAEYMNFQKTLPKGFYRVDTMQY